MSYRKKMSYVLFAIIISEASTAWGIETRQNPQDFSENISLQAILPHYTQHGLLAFYRILFSDLPGSTQERTPYALRQGPFIKKLIYNQTGYDEGVTDLMSADGNKITIGNPLSLDDGTPIGYNIMLPIGEVKGALVKVYGGMPNHKRNTHMFKPGPNDVLDLVLLDEGIAVITLNLPDLLELTVHQMEMPENLHKKIHSSINKFYETMSKNPEMLDKELAALKGTKLYLYGGSFGGRTSIRHAEMFPGTFNGYISHDGTLSPNIATLTDRTKRGESPEALNARNWLAPMTNDPQSDEKISPIQDPILLLHSYDDNNVNILVTLDWYKKAKKVGKGSLVQVLFTERGNPQTQLNEISPTKGHLTPTDKESFEKYAQKISNFILQNDKISPEESQARFEKAMRQVIKMRMFAYKSYSDASLQDKFLSEAYRLYRSASHLAKNLEAEELSPLSIATPPLQEKAWKKYYEPLYYALAYLEKIKDNQEMINEELLRLKSQGLLTPKRLSNALKRQLPNFLDYLQEYKGITIPRSEISSLSDSLEMQINFHKWVLEEIPLPTLKEKLDLEHRMMTPGAHHRMNSYDLRNDLMNTLYLANPDLLEPLYYSFEDDSQIQSGLEAAKNNFLSKIQKLTRESAKSKRNIP